MLVMMNSLQCSWSWLLRSNHSDPPWTMGSVEYAMNEKKPQVLFGVSCSIFEPCQSHYIEGGRYVDAKGDLEIVGAITM